MHALAGVLFEVRASVRWSWSAIIVERDHNMPACTMGVPYAEDLVALGKSG